MKKKLGKGSVSLLLIVLALVWDCSLPVLGGKCLGDLVLTALGLPTWSNGTTGLHFTFFLSLILFIPAFVVGIRNKDDLFARAGMWISSIVCGTFLVVGTAILLFGKGEGGSYEIIYGTIQDRAMAKMHEYDYSGHGYITLELDDGSSELFWLEDNHLDFDAEIGDYVMIEAIRQENSEDNFVANLEVLEE